MATIHFIKKTSGGLSAITKVCGEENAYVSGNWTLSEETARTFMNGRIYFHELQRSPSYYGGTIVGIDRISEGEFEGKIAFKFIFSDECRGVQTGPDGWVQEMKMCPDVAQ